MHVAIPAVPDMPLQCAFFKDKDGVSHTENCALFWVITQRVVVINFLPTFCDKLSAPEERSSFPPHGGSLKSRSVRHNVFTLLALVGEVHHSVPGMNKF
jgi:hypothetical protein